MIGVIANPSDYTVVHEFFELFKTQWEFYRAANHYGVLLCTEDIKFEENSADLILIYTGSKHRSDAEEHVNSQKHKSDAISYKGTRIPIYGDFVTFSSTTADLVDEISGEPALCLSRSGRTTIVRIGYDLFREVSILLTLGQPVANAGIPTLELHVALLRDLIVQGGVSFVEVPPVPAGYRFIACLTHDIDHPSIRRHKFDHTIVGFLYRAILISFLDTLRGRTSVRCLLKNWAAAARLPFVYCGLAKDFWREFDRFTELEAGVPSTFFVIPFADRAGQKHAGKAPRFRAARYGAADIADQIAKLNSQGNEIGLHGLDAWVDSSRGREELDEIRRITSTAAIGVRMHWLYFDDQSPRILEQAGADWDSTVGYNETVGYRTGTTQAYKPFEAARLLELPLHVMDTALFFRNYLNLSPTDARKRVDEIIDHAAQFGGCITVNWHDRSIVPERLWGEFYAELVNELRRKGAWFATATEAVSWFRKRRGVSWDAGKLTVTVPDGEKLPGLQLQVYNGKERSSGSVASTLAPDVSDDLLVKESIPTSLCPQ